MIHKYDPADIPVFILKEGARREVAFLIFKTGLVWDKDCQRMLGAEEVAELFEGLEVGFEQTIEA